MIRFRINSRHIIKTSKVLNGCSNATIHELTPCIGIKPSGVM